MRNYSFMQNFPENYSIIQYKNKREPPVKIKAGTEAYADQKNCIPVFQRRRYNFRFLTISTFFISRYTLSLRCNRLTIRYRII